MHNLNVVTCYSLASVMLQLLVGCGPICTRAFDASFVEIAEQKIYHRRKKIRSIFLYTQLVTLTNAL